MTGTEIVALKHNYSLRLMLLPSSVAGSQGKSSRRESSFKTFLWSFMPSLCNPYTPKKSLHLWPELPVLSAWVESGNQILIKILITINSLTVALVHLHPDLHILRATADPPAVSSLPQDGSWWSELLIFHVKWGKAFFEGFTLCFPLSCSNTSSNSQSSQ